MNTVNQRIREYAKQRNVKLWELAAAMKIADTTLSRHLRTEFAPEDTEKAVRLIDEIAADRR